MILKCAIMDDEPLALGLMESYVEKTPFLTLAGRYSSAVAAMEKLQESPVDLLFLDIQMPELNGLEFSRMVGKDCRIVFTTAFSQYAIEGFKVDALDYLLKPISYPEFLKAANKALEWFTLKSRPDSRNKIFVKSEYRLVGIETGKILYVEALKDYVKIHVEGQEYPVLSLMSMKAIEEMLPAGQFLRVHKSYIVNKDKIAIIERGKIIFGDTAVPVGDNYRTEFAAFLKGKS